MAQAGRLVPSSSDSPASAVNINPTRSRTGLATVIGGAHGHAVASVTLVGPTSQVLPRLESLSDLLPQRVEAWRGRSTAAAREPI